MPLFILVCILLPGMGPGNPGTHAVTGEAKTAFLQTWSERLRTTQTLHMVFTQEKHLRLLQRPLIAHGELWLKGDRLRYVLKNPDGEIELDLHKDEQRVQIYYPHLHTLEVIDLHSTPTLPLAIPFLGRAPAALTQDYQTELFVNAELYTLHLLPKDPNALFSEICLLLKDFRPQLFLRVENNGDRVTMSISAFTPNADIHEDQLTLSIPAGTKVTYPLK